MALNVQARRAVMRQLADAMAATAPVALTKDQLVEVVGAADDWLEANAASFNAALPQPQRGTLTIPQKAALLSLVALARFGG